MEASSTRSKVNAQPDGGGTMNYPIYEINGVKTYRTPKHLRTLRDVACRACAKPVSMKTKVCESCGYQFPTEENSK
jgi:ribosomal protein L37E